MRKISKKKKKKATSQLAKKTSICELFRNSPVNILIIIIAEEIKNFLKKKFANKWEFVEIYNKV